MYLILDYIKFKVNYKGEWMWKLNKYTNELGEWKLLKNLLCFLKGKVDLNAKNNSM